MHLKAKWNRIMRLRRSIFLIFSYLTAYHPVFSKIEHLEGILNPGLIIHSTRSCYNPELLTTGAMQSHICRLHHFTGGAPSIDANVKLLI